MATNVNTSDACAVALGEASSVYVNAGPENLSTLSQSHLMADMDAFTTQVPVFSGMLFPRIPTFRIKIGSEVMRVIDVMGLTFTVVRGTEGTTATVHLAGAIVRSCLTTESLTAFVSQHGGQTIAGSSANMSARSTKNTLFLPTDQQVAGIFDDVAQTWLPYGPVRAVTPPNINDFTWANQGGASAYCDGGCITLQNSYRNTYDAAMLWKPVSNPTRPWSVTMGMLPANSDANYQRCGLAVGSSTGGGMLGWEGYRGTQLLLTLYNSTFTGITDYVVNGFMHGMRPLWLKYSEDSTLRHFFLSFDGISWLQVYQEANNNVFTVDRVGLMMSYMMDGGNAQWMTCFHWQESNP